MSEDVARANMAAALEFLRDELEDIRVSSVYQTPGIGSGKGKTYHNAVVIGYSSLAAEDIKPKFKAFETKLGRNDDTRKHDIVPIDIDLLSLGETIYKEKDLKQDYVKIGLDEIVNSR